MALEWVVGRQMAASTDAGGSGSTKRGSTVPSVLHRMFSRCRLELDTKAVSALCFLCACISFSFSLSRSFSSLKSAAQND